ncbi:MAG: hypothetical protein ABSF91_15865 [Bacteroidota bacterium]|jgi:hypothetical protein
MLKSTLFAIVCGSLIFATDCSAQGESAVPFLLISPSAEASGMGETSVALVTDDPLGPMTNPAHLGMLSLENHFSYGNNFSNWLPAFNIPDLWYRTIAINAGINLKKLLAISPELGIGLGYSRIYLNLGQFVETGPSGPTPIGTFNAHETSDQFTLGVGINYWVKASAGITLKHILSSLAQFDVQRQGREGSATVNSYDYGLLLQVPVVGVLNQLREERIQFSPYVSPFFDFSVGLAENNLGDKKVIYIDAAQADPLPRYARAGIGFDLGVTYNREDFVWRPLSFKWTIESNDLLVRRYGNVVDSLGNIVKPGYWEYQGGLGDINFFDEVILGKTNTETIKKRGWELNFFDIIVARGGRFEEDYNRGNRRFNTSGYSFRLAGFVKVLRAMAVPIANDNILGFIVNHVDVRFTRSELTPDDPDSPLARTEFNSFNILISN